MNAFKKSEKPTHKLYSNPAQKEFLTNKEFAQDLSVDSVDLNPSFDEFQGSFFSRDSSEIDKEILDQLKDFEDRPAQKSKSLIIPEEQLRKNKEEETNYTSKQNFVKLEQEEFKRAWFCQSCIMIESVPSKKNCELF